MIKNRYQYPLIIIISFLLIMMIFSPYLVSAQLVPCTDECSFTDLYTLINKIINFIVFVLAVPIAALVITLAGIWLVIYPSNEGKRKEALGMIRTAVVGLLIVLSAYLIVKAIIFGLAGDSDVGNRLRGIFE